RSRSSWPRARTRRNARNVSTGATSFASRKGRRLPIVRPSTTARLSTSRSCARTSRHPSGPAPLIISSGRMCRRRPATSRPTSRSRKRTRLRSRRSKHAREWAAGPRVRPARLFHRPRLHADRFAHQGHRLLGLRSRPAGAFTQDVFDRGRAFRQLLPSFARRAEELVDLFQERLLGLAVAHAAGAVTGRECRLLLLAGEQAV